MELYFERGTRESPKGHALVYFRHRYNREEVLATYLITLPIKADMSKYIPPLFAAQMQGISPQELFGFAFPPVPERVESLSQLQHLAELRDDDLLDGGTVDSNDPMSLLHVVNELQQEYSHLWERSLEEQISAEPTTVSEVFYELMGERDRLSELSKMVGKLRFAAEGSDPGMVRETEEEILALGKYLPERYQIPRLLKVATIPAQLGSKLAELYLERCYKLFEEDYRRLQEVEGEIRQIEEGLGSSPDSSG